MPLYLSRKRVLGSEFSVRVTVQDGTPVPTTISVAAGSYYNGALVAGESLSSALQTALNTHPDAGGLFGVSYDITGANAGKFSIVHGSVFDLDFVTPGQAGTDLRNWLGFTGNKAGAATYTSDNLARGAIFTGSGRSDYKRKRDQDSGTAKSTSGVAGHLGSGNRLRMASWVHRFEASGLVASPLQSGTWDDPETYVPWVWEDFWDHHTTSGEPFRYYNTTPPALGSVDDTYVFDRKMYGPFEPEMLISNSERYWIVKVSADRWIEP